MAVEASTAAALREIGEMMQNSKAASVNLPRWLSYRLNAEGQKRISGAVGLAESRTVGEIVPVLVRASSPIGHVTLLSFAAVALVLSAIAPLIQISLVEQFSIDAPFWAFEVGALLIAALIAPFAHHSEWVLRSLITRHDRDMNCTRRAQLEFYHSRVNSTDAHTGVLIFVSLLERKAIILGDAAIAQKLTAVDWQDAVDLLLKGMRGGDVAGGFVAAIERAGQHLAEHFPASRHDRNELPNCLLIRE